MPLRHARGDRHRLARQAAAGAQQANALAEGEEKGVLVVSGHTCSIVRDMDISPPEPLNFAQHLFQINAGRAAKIAYVDDRAGLSYGQLEERSRRFAAALLGLGIRREERVLLLMLDANEWPISFLGCLYAGIVPVAVNTLLTADDYAYMLAHSRAQAAIVSAALAPLLGKAMAQAKNEVKHLIVAGPAETLPAGALAFDSLLAASEPLAEPAATRGDDPGVLAVFVGLDRQAQGHGPHPRQRLVDDRAVRQAGARPDRSRRLLLRRQALLRLRPRQRPELSARGRCDRAADGGAADAGRGLQALDRRRRRRGHGHGDPADGLLRRADRFAGMLASPGLPAREAVALRMCSSAGEALPSEIGQRFERHFGAPIVDGIGSTEMLHVFLSNRVGDVRYGTTGRPVEGYEIELRGDDGRPVGDGEVGDLYIRARARR
jgi:benzoate-CoA ligase